MGQQGLEQAAHNHRIGNVADLHFIEAQNLRLLCQVHGDLRHHIGFAERLAALVNVLHEGMEVDALLGLHLQVCKKQIHQHGFAAAHVAINVDALGRAVLVQESSDGAALFTGLKRLGQADRDVKRLRLARHRFEARRFLFFPYRLQAARSPEDTQEKCEHGDIGRNDRRKAER